MVTSELSSDGRSGGAGLYAYRLSKELARKGHNVDMIANITRPFEMQTAFSIYELKLSPLRVIGMLKWGIAAFVYSMKLIEANSYDVVHVNNLTGNMYSLIWCLRTPMIATMQSGWALTNPRYSRLRRIIYFLIDLAVCSKCRRIIVLNRDVELQLRRWGIPQEKIKHIPMGIDCSEFLEGEKGSTTLRQKLGIPQNAIVVLSVGRLIIGKGVEKLLEAWQIVQRHTSRTWAIVAGDGPLKSSLMRMARNLPHIVFTGSMGHADGLSAAYAESDLFVMTSEGGEGMPTVLLEAMAAGLPVIATRIPGNTEVVDPRFGKLIAPGNAQQLALAVLDLISDPTTLRKMGNQASLFSKRYDWSNIASRIVKVYESCLQV